MARRRGPRRRKRFTAVVADKTRYNEKIRATELRVINSKGENLGVLSLEEALRVAREEGLDLVEVNSSPTVGKILDYGKFKYQQQKKEAKSKSKQHQATLKELRLRPGTGDHDLRFKLAKAREFLTHGDKVQFTVWFKGRERSFAGRLGKEVIENVVEQLEDVAKVERDATFQHRRMNVVLAPLAGKPKSARLETAAPAPTESGEAKTPEAEKPQSPSPEA